MDPVIVLLALVGAFTVAAMIIMFLAGFVAGAHRRFGRRVFVALSGVGYGAEKSLVGIFKTAYYICSGHKWHDRHYHRR